MILVTTDLHQVDKPSEEFRFEIFDWLVDQQLEHEVSAVYILGDLTNAKDRHSSVLVNRIVDGLHRLAEVTPTFCVKGNHDYVDPNSPFFKFLSKIPNLYFVNEPTVNCPDGESVNLLLPHTDNPDAWNNLDFNHGFHYIFIHQTIEGAIAESGRRLSGLSASPLAAFNPRRIYAGDIHNPQRVGPVTYIGPPYQIRFGDNFTPRVLLLDPQRDKERWLYYESPRKVLLDIRDVDEIPDTLHKGDHVKVRLELTREEAVEWPVYRSAIKERCQDLGLVIFGIELKVKKTTKRKRLKRTVSVNRSPAEILTDFCKKEKVGSEIRETGSKLLGV